MKLRDTKVVTHDYLKYYSVIRHFIRAKYKLTNADLDMLLFLYSEKYFSSTDYDEFNQLFFWNKKRFYNLIHNGWITDFREKKGGSKCLYQVSYKACRMIISMYKKLNGEEIPTSRHNPMFLRKVGYSDKVYRNMIKRMNEELRAKKFGIED